MKTYPTLYSRDSHGKIRIWFQQQNGDKFRTVAGVKGSDNLVEAEWTTALPKNVGKTNATTGQEQATAEIKAKYKKQKESGYFEDEQNIDETQYFEPMLAKKYEDRKDEIDWSRGNYISPKLDGVRFVATKNGLFSRNGKEFVSCPHIARELEPLFKKYPNLVLDGECYCDKLSNDFNKIISLAKKSKPTAEDIKESEEYLQYWIFDCPSAIGGFHDRYNALLGLYADNLKKNKWIKICEHTLIKTAAEIEVNLNKYIEAGFEGLMLNTYDGKYENKRSKNLLKYKLFQDGDFEIVGVTEGVGNRSGGLGFFTLQMKDGTMFDSNARGNEAYYKEILRNKNKFIGKMATCRFQNLTPEKGIPRFPVVISVRDYE